MHFDEKPDLIYMTYYMIDWTKVSEKPIKEKCIVCKNEMSLIELESRNKVQYLGYVCHACKRITWVRK